MPKSQENLHSSEVTEKIEYKSVSAPPFVEDPEHKDKEGSMIWSLDLTADNKGNLYNGIFLHEETEDYKDKKIEILGSAGKMVFKDYGEDEALKIKVKNEQYGEAHLLVPKTWISYVKGEELPEESKKHIQAVIKARRSARLASRNERDAGGNMSPTWEIDSAADRAYKKVFTAVYDQETLDAFDFTLKYGKAIQPHTRLKLGESSLGKDDNYLIPNVYDLAAYKKKEKVKKDVSIKEKTFTPSRADILKGIYTKEIITKEIITEPNTLIILEHPDGSIKHTYICE